MGEYESDIKSETKRNVREVMDGLLFCAAVYFQFCNERLIMIAGIEVAIRDSCFLYEIMYCGVLYKKMKKIKYLFYSLFAVIMISLAV